MGDLRMASSCPAVVAEACRVRSKAPAWRSPRPHPRRTHRTRPHLPIHPTKTPESCRRSTIERHIPVAGPPQVGCLGKREGAGEERKGGRGVTRRRTFHVTFDLGFQRPNRRAAFHLEPRLQVKVRRADSRAHDHLASRWGEGNATGCHADRGLTLTVLSSSSTSSSSSSAASFSSSGAGPLGTVAPPRQRVTAGRRAERWLACGCGGSATLTDAGVDPHTGEEPHTVAAASTLSRHHIALGGGGSACCA